MWNACRYVDAYAYDPAYDFMAGQELNVDKFSAEPLLGAAGAPYNYSQIVVIFPSVFVHKPQLYHFLAYARGASQVFIDTIVPPTMAMMSEHPVVQQVTANVQVGQK